MKTIGSRTTDKGFNMIYLNFTIFQILKEHISINDSREFSLFICGNTCIHMLMSHA